MLPSRARLRPLAVFVKVVLILLVIDWWVAGPFFDRYIVGHFVAPFKILRDRTSGRNLSILFETLRRSSNAGITVAFVGDSTMNSADGLDTTFAPYLVGEELRQRLKRRDIEPVDASELGLYARDAALFVTKLIGGRTDVIVYGVQLRAFPKHPLTQYVSDIGNELGPADVARVINAGGGYWLMHNLDSKQMISGFVHTDWALYAFRAPLKRCIWDSVLGPTLPDSGALRRFFEPPPLQQEAAEAPRRMTGARYEWTRADYGIPNPNWRALDLLGRLCARYAAGRCVMYAGPINPLGRGRLVEPGLYEEYLSALRVAAGRYGLIWRDFTDAMKPEDFRVPKHGGLRDPIHLNETGRAKLAALLVEPVSEALQSVVAPPQRSKS